ncbi:hypothetical protein ACOMHN_009817 [Nucella lapillus]
MASFVALDFLMAAAAAAEYRPEGRGRDKRTWTGQGMQGRLSREPPQPQCRVQNSPSAVRKTRLLLQDSVTLNASHTTHLPANIDYTCLRDWQPPAATPETDLYVVRGHNSIRQLSLCIARWRCTHHSLPSSQPLSDQITCISEEKFR